MAKYAQKVEYTMNFSQMQIGPIIESRILPNYDVLALFAKQQPMQEDITRKSEGDIVAEAKTAQVAKEEAPVRNISPKSEETETRTYTFTYINPETDKAEVLTTKSEVKIKDKIQMDIEEAVGSKSALAIYSFVATPLMIKRVDPILLEKILNDMEYDTPPKFGGGQVVLREKPKSEVVAVDSKEAVREALVLAVSRKDEVEKKLGEEIVVLDDALKQLNKNTPVEQVIEKLPPLTRARFEILLRKKRVSSQIVAILLKKDAAFLRGVKGKLQGMGAKELYSLVKSLKQMLKG